MLKNQELAEQIYDMMNTAIDASWQMRDFLLQDQTDVFQQIAEDLYALLDSIRQISKELDEEQEGMNLWASSESVCVSLERINRIVPADTERAAHKIEFELIPLLEEMRVRFYYFGMVYPDEERMKNYYEKEIARFAINRYQEEAEKSGNYKYELSIMVMAYNKLEYTKQCITALKKAIPEGISYELILGNHGSDDGTKEFFESLHPDKQLDVAVNGGGIFAMYRIAEGRFVLLVSNDVLVMENAIQNMYEGMRADDSIAWVVPATTNASNFQAVEREFRSLEEVLEYAHVNNVRDPFRWEQRIRLVNPIDMFRGSLLNKFYWTCVFQSPDLFSFPDDKLSLVCRRNGYKMFLAKDSFCFHYGSVTLGQGDTGEKFAKGRREFQRVFGVDPWGTGFCYSYNLAHEVTIDKKTPVRILGIGCGFGAVPLKIKEQLKENVHNTDVYIKALTTRSNLVNDLKGSADEVELIEDYSALSETNTYDYVVCEEFEPVHESLVGFVEHLYHACKPEGKVLLSVTHSLAKEIFRTKNRLKSFFDGMVVVLEEERCWLVLDKK